MTHSDGKPRPCRFVGPNGSDDGQVNQQPDHRPVDSLADLRTLDEGDVLDGYLSGVHGQPCPAERCSRAFWHGWRTGMMDRGDLLPDDATLALRREAEEQRRPV